MSYELLNQYFQDILIVCLIFLSLLVLVAVIRSIRGPRTTDRIIAINMIGTLTMAMFLILTVYLGEDYLADVCLIYAMISFLAVVVLTKIYEGIYHSEKEKMEEKTEEKMEAKIEEKIEEKRDAKEDETEDFSSGKVSEREEA